MRIPKAPPTGWLNTVKTMDFSALTTAMGRGPAPDGRYRHWDKLRHLNPPKGLTSEQWWAGLKLARAGLLRRLPLLDTKGVPFHVGSPDPVLAFLHRIDRDATGSLTSRAEPITNPATRDYYLVRSLMEEAISSSLLEGAATTRLVAKEMLRTKRKPMNRGEQMVLNNYHAIEHIRSLVGKPLEPSTVIDLQRILTEGTMDDPSASGRLRTGEDRVRVEDQYGEVLHVPPPAEALEERLARMCEFANGKLMDGFIHPMVRAVLLHFWLAYDHPFIDGNGRTARALFYWSSISQGYWLMEFITLSTILNRAQGRYGRAFLYAETDENDATYFLLHQLGALSMAMDDLYSYVASRTQEIGATEALVRRSSLFNHRQIELLTRALKHAGERYSIEDHAQRHRIVYQTARTDLLGLEEKGLFVKVRAGRRFLFSAVPEMVEKLRAL